MVFDTRDNTGAAIGAAAVTPNDSADLAKTPTRALWVGIAGNVKVDMADGSTVTIAAVQAGSMLPIQVKRVYSTGTTALSMTAFY